MIHDDAVSHAAEAVVKMTPIQSGTVIGISTLKMDPKLWRLG